MEPFLGQIMMVGFNFAPRGWALCDGSILPISSYTALFSLLGTTYGGDGRTTFALPDLRGRAPIGMGHGPGLSLRAQGAKGGAETTTLNVTNIPSHNHSVAPSPVNASSQNATEQVPGTNGATTLASPVASGRPAAIYNNQTPDVTLNTAGGNVLSTGNTGGSIPFNNMEPFIAMNYVIALNGIFPSRN
ncbi:tail fiber protein [Algoriphagus halophytocola]|uniref:Tail fiber protein n=1 Tax=Algoriphagus halophytocola TaxID=2991499 RepID=A0ABY6MN73_9BACT|nr:MULTISPECIES: tail fiber protein [unclassified Algoriphagus]UZD24136.1 tail fiber protein [Algoriphagus sp. TR-M5]WBL41507.1 tail fiber protein [Algoriphagus sp. TR-M9]